MGFFSDLKDDLSQAVNELMPEDGEEGMDDAAATATSNAGSSEDDFEVNLSKMLDRVDENTQATRRVMKKSLCRKRSRKFL